ncbi:MAG: Na(+)/H(+) antiporter subunit B [Rhodospirillales bacterium]|nr:Na(+)/H(+) antiporter subunit B [Rhodospirillales bacterium]
MARIRDLFAVAMLSGIYSLLAAVLYVTMDAVDVAFTEAAVGAGIATVLMLGTLALTTTKEKIVPRRIGPFAIVLLTGAALLYGTLDMPPYGDPDAPANHHVAPRYIEKSGAEVGMPNIVTSVLASYRGYDTLGEVAVIFTAAVGVLLLMGRHLAIHRRQHKKIIEIGKPMIFKSILRVTSKLLIPLILLFALYVQFHGDYGPGGGFQAGVIFSSAFILYALIFGIDNARKVFPMWLLRFLLAAGVLIYAGVGVASLILGGNFLDYSVLAKDPIAGQHLGIFLIELGVGTTVAAAMATIFFIFAGQSHERRSEPRENNGKF